MYPAVSIVPRMSKNAWKSWKARWNAEARLHDTHGAWYECTGIDLDNIRLNIEYQVTGR
jgi:hypothetical protein